MNTDNLPEPQSKVLHVGDNNINLLKWQVVLITAIIMIQHVLYNLGLEFYQHLESLVFFHNSTRLTVYILLNI